MTSNPPAKQDQQFVPAMYSLSRDQIKAQVRAVKDIMDDHMAKGVHYGIIPGTKEPTLFKAGTELLAFIFCLAPRYEVEREELPNWHRGYTVTCHISTRDTGMFLGSGLGSASTMESKYRYRHAQKVCPKCGQEAIIKSKPDFGGGWYCMPPKGGCGAKFNRGDQQIEGQKAGKVENADPADAFNTVLKMAKKRAFNDAILTVLAVGEIFKHASDDDPVDADYKEHPPAQDDAQPTLDDVLAACKISKKQKDKLLSYVDSFTNGNEANRPHIYQKALSNPQGFKASFDAWCQSQQPPAEEGSGSDPANGQRDSPGGPDPSSFSGQSDELLDQINAVLYAEFPGKSGVDYLNRQQLLELAFNTTEWASIRLLGPMHLKPGLDKIKAELKRQSQKFDPDTFEDPDGILERIDKVLYAKWPGLGEPDNHIRHDLLERNFGTNNKRKISIMDPDKLKKGLKNIEAEIKAQEDQDDGAE